MIVAQGLRRALLERTAEAHDQDGGRLLPRQPVYLLLHRLDRPQRGTVRVEDAQGMMPNIPFWLGEAPGRTMELSESVSRLRREFEQVSDREPGGAIDWLRGTLGIDAAGATQLIQYLAAGRAALGCLPTLDTIVFERFFDESGGMQLIIHSPFGSRVNRAWGLSPGPGGFLMKSSRSLPALNESPAPCQSTTRT